MHDHEWFWWSRWQHKHYVMVLDQGPNNRLSGLGGARDPALDDPGASQAHVDGGARPGGEPLSLPKPPSFLGGSK